ncbi:hypothetical protein GGR58DRAFT_518758 [Xylaria digitata]|nr:hypothetical protein GGR58DRAFT_518758 [Xylaria digitata]
MYRCHSIISWIHSLPAHAGSPPKGSRKRKRAQRQQHLTSPPDSDEMTSTPKKRRFDSADDAGDLDITPRPGADGSVSLSDTGSSIPSGASSPRKQMLDLRLRDPGVEINALDPNALPAAARRLVTAMEDIGHRLEILPHALESIIMEDVKARDLARHQWRHSFKPPEEVDGLPGRIPTFKEVEKVCRKASECQQYSHEEASWNSQVHLRLLDGIFEGPDGQCNDFNAMSCTTARLHRAFKPIWSPTKMIDICVYASTNQCADLGAKISDFSRITPTATVNHTDFAPIGTRPLLLSIETKKPGVHWDAAQFQIGIWHASQWAFLRWAVAAKIRRQRIEGEAEAPQTQKEQDELEAKALSIVSSLEFIPSVIVQGHRWHLVLSTYEGGKTKLWADRQFGTTQTCLETYSIIAGMRQLTAWAKDVYLPWFKTNVLD